MIVQTACYFKIHTSTHIYIYKYIYTEPDDSYVWRS